MQLSKFIAIGTCLSICIVGVYAQPSANKNYIITNTVKVAGITNQSQIDALSFATQGKNQSIAYFDGLGRPLQMVTVKGSPMLRDIVAPMIYDSFGRKAKEHLPYMDTATSNFGSFKSNWATRQPAFYNGQLQGVDISPDPFAQTVFEPSPLNRVLAQGAPGTVWQPNMSDPYDTDKKVTKLKYEINKAQDNVRIFYVDTDGDISSPGNYASGKLTIKVSVDEHNNITKAYSDKSGHILLKRVFIESDSLQTYYVYDDFEQLKAVIQPEGVADIPTSGSWTPDSDFIRRWMFLYQYDDRGRTIMKKVPGADSVLIVYDQWDRVVLTQDGNQQLQFKWSFTKYDAHNRPVVTGEMVDGRPLATIKSDAMSSSDRFETINSFFLTDYFYTLDNTFPSSNVYTLTPLTINLFDNYANLYNVLIATAFVSEHGISSYNNFINGQKFATLTRILGTNDWLRSLYYYDDKYRIVQQANSNAIDGYDRTTRVLTFDGKVEEEYQTHGSSFYSTPLVTKRSFTYDHADRPLKILHQVNSQEEITLWENTYNELGQLLNKKIHKSLGIPGYLQKLDYTYNIRGWLKAVNKPYDNSPGYEENDLFNFELHYDTAKIYQGTPCYNANIAEQVWKGGYDEYLKGYKYKYDKANRFKEAEYGFKDNASQWDFTMRYNEKIGSYDHNGNIIQLDRYHGIWNRVDALDYLYDGNQLTRINDGIFTALTIGFKDRSSFIDDYQYDANGNMNFDFNKEITSIVYNHLNLPQSIDIYQKGNISYTYDAAGNKLKKIVTDETVSPAKGTSYTYAGAFVYKNDTLEHISHEEGRLRPQKIDVNESFSPENLKYVYDYFLKDHLGNVRSVITPETSTALYAATMETANATKEELLFTNIASTRFSPKPGGFDSDGANEKVSRLHGNISTSGNYRVGPSLVIKVMAGDTVSIGTKAWYSGSAQAPPSGLSPLADELVSLLTSGIIGNNGTKGGAVSSGDIESWMGGIVSDFLTDNDNNNYDNTKPKAFLNWMVVDEDFKATGSSNHVGAVQVPTISGGTEKQTLVGPTDMVVRRNGWLYVYVSNESNQNVYFDDLVVNHKHGPVLEQSDYYPFGMEIAGISSKALAFGGSENKYKFNDGSELESKEFGDGSGLEWYATEFRSLDPQIGRWWQIDPKPTESVSLYAAMDNDPIRFNDPLGDTTIFYGYQGNRIFAVNDNGANRTVVLDEKKEDAFYNSYYQNFALVPDDKRNLSAMSKTLSAFGTSYDVAAFENFYDQNGSSVPATNVAGTPTESMTDIKINGKPTKLYAEVMGNLVMKNGVVTVGNGKSTTGDLVSSDPDKLPSETGKVGNIHTHPVAANATLQYKTSSGSGGGSFRAGPSPDDRQVAGRNSDGVRNVVVDQKNVYLINRWSGETVTIPKRR
jgi:RHS repeat-associated protein